jgi:hypothetical protein
MTKAQIKAAEKHARLRRKALLHMLREPIHELRTAPLGITGELIRDGLAQIGRQYVARGFECQEIILTEAGKREVDAMISTAGGG